MLLYFLSRITSATGAFVYPAYASYKTLSKRPASEADIERWLMYWSVLGTIVGLEYVAEWSVSWVPFYHTFKSLFLLYLALPQTRGASYVYKVHLHPFVAKHEVEIDAALGRVKEEIWRWVMLRVKGLWDHVTTGDATRELAGSGAGVGKRVELPEQPASPAVPTGPTQLAYTLWQTYGPALAAFLNPPPSNTAQRSPSPSPSPTRAQAQPSTSHPITPILSSTLTSLPTTDQLPRGTTSALDMHPDAALLARRRALEAELSTLPLPNPHDRASNHDAIPAFPTPQLTTAAGVAAFSGTQQQQMSASFSAMPRHASSAYLPAAGDERGRYEEIRRDEIDSDEDGAAELHRRLQDGPDAGLPAWSQWWWGKGSPQGSGYERVKTE